MCPLLMDMVMLGQFNTSGQFNVTTGKLTRMVKCTMNSIPDADLLFTVKIYEGHRAQVIRQWKFSDRSACHA